MAISPNARGHGEMLPIANADTADRPATAFVSDLLQQCRRDIARLRRRVAELPVASESAICPHLSMLIDDSLGAAELLLGNFAESRLRCEQLAAEVSDLEARWDVLFEQGPVGCLEIDAAGTIVRANARSSLLLNLSARYLQNRKLLYFLDDRSHFVSLLGDATLNGASTRGRLTVRPRDRAVVEVEALLVRQPNTDPPTCLCFLIEPTRSPRHQGIRTGL